MAGDDDEISMQEVFTRSLYVTPTTTEQHLIVSNDKSITYVHCVSKKITIDLKDCARRFVLSPCPLLKLTPCTDRLEASRSLFVTAELLVLNTYRVM